MVIFDSTLTPVTIQFAMMVLIVRLRFQQFSPEEYFWVMFNQHSQSEPKIAFKGLCRVLKMKLLEGTNEIKTQDFHQT